jgi:hypothetical protein
MALLLAPLRWLTSSILRLLMLAAIALVLYFVLLRPAIDSGERKLSQTFHSLEKKASPNHLKHCLERADGDLDKMKRCSRIF